jgi:hypothetical protein
MTAETRLDGCPRPGRPRACQVVAGLPLLRPEAGHFHSGRRRRDELMTAADEWFAAGRNGSKVDVAAMFDNKAPELLWELLGYGALASLGLTSDGGALGVTLTVDGAWRREYFRQAEDLEIWLSDAREPIAEACAHRDASSVPRARSRGTRGRYTGS